MKILHIIDNMSMGGAQTILKGIFENEITNENIYCYSLRNNKTEVKVNHPNVYSHAGYSKFNIISLFELRTLVHNYNIDVLHCHLAKSMFFGFILKLLFFKNIKLIFHEHGRIFQNKAWYGQLIKKMQSKADLYIAVSKTTKIRLENVGIKKDKIKVLYNFVDLENLNPNILKKYDRMEQRKNLEINEDDFVIGFAARLVKIKGWNTFIKSARILSNTNTNLKFLIVGEGVDKQKVINLISVLDLKNTVQYLGFYPNIQCFYAIIDTLIVPSQFESFGISAIEAQACGVPVIASNVEALNEIIKNKNNGLLFEFANETDLAKKIELMYNNENLRLELTKNGLKNVGKYSLKNYANKLEEIYQGSKTNNMKKRVV